MPAQVTDEGVIKQTLGQIQEEIQNGLRDEFGPGFQTGTTTARTFTERLTPIFAESIANLQDLALALTAVLSIKNATGVFVDFHGSLVQLARSPATRSTIQATASGTPGEDISDRRVRYIPNDTLWRVATGTVFGPNGSADTKLEAVDSGAVFAAPAGSESWVIVDPLPNPDDWTDIATTSNVVLGEPRQSDKAFKADIEAARGATDGATEIGIPRAVRTVPGVTRARLFNNRTLFFDVNGVAPKSNELVVTGGDTQDVAKKILEVYGDTSGFVGTTTVEVVKDDGTVVEVKYSPVRFLAIEVLITITASSDVNAPALPTNTRAIAQAAVAAYINDGLLEGVDVDADPLASSVEANLPPGSTDLVTARVAFRGNPLGPGPLVLTIREKAITDTEPQPAQVTGIEVEPFDLLPIEILDLAVDGGSPQTVTFAPGDFANIAEATAIEVANVINEQTTGLDSAGVEGALSLVSQLAGSQSSIEILPTSSASLLTKLGLAVGVTAGSDGDVTVDIL